MKTNPYCYFSPRVVEWFPFFPYTPSPYRPPGPTLTTALRGPGASTNCRLRSHLGTRPIFWAPTLLGWGKCSSVVGWDFERSGWWLRCRGLRTHCHTPSAPGRAAYSGVARRRGPLGRRRGSSTHCSRPTVPSPPSN